jgi:regulator of RNase E activity RraA
VFARSDDVIVFDAGGNLTNTLINETVAAKAIEMGGVPCNMAIRDAEQARLAVLLRCAAEATDRGPDKDGPGERHVLVATGCMLSHPGGLFVSDAQARPCIPRDDIEKVLMVAQQRMGGDIAANRLDKAWIDMAIRRIGRETEPS